MSRVDELQKKYPDLLRDFIIKWEVLSQGVRDSEALDKTSDWTRGGSYQSRDLDITMKAIADRRPGTMRPGYVMRPRPLFTKNGFGAGIRRHSRTPYEVREESEDKYALYENEERVDDVYFPSPKEWGDNLITSRGTPASTIVSAHGRCFFIQPLRFCEYFVSGEQCKFCNYNSTYDDARATGTDIATTVNMEDTVEAYKMISSQVRLIEGRWQSGALKSSEKETGAYINYVERIAKAASYTPNMTMSTQPADRKQLQRLKDAGLSCIHFNMEVWGAELFAEVCPGKAKYRGFEHYKDGYLDALDVFGEGNVSCNFVAGVSMMPENGHKTWQEARDSLIEGFTWLIKNRVFCTTIGLRLGVGSIYGDDKSNWAKVPPTEYYLETGMAHHKLMTEHGLYDTLNRLMFCPMDCPDAMYCGELGMVEIAGDIGKWAAKVFPPEANWLGRFIDSMQAQATTQ
ncbi:MAG: hypothetical protein Q7O66_12660 [Dehalococcoidia bacterium]|nr:hypothetical protein [Dehalococcoidia bacterium]